MGNRRHGQGHLPLPGKTKICRYVMLYLIKLPYKRVVSVHQAIVKGSGAAEGASYVPVPSRENNSKEMAQNRQKYSFITLTQ